MSMLNGILKATLCSNGHRIIMREYKHIDKSMEYKFKMGQK